ncbi:MAG: hypothetical protein ABIN05_04415 [candidate division WOR-3 bacterium]
MFCFKTFYLLLFFYFQPDTVKLEKAYDFYVFENPIYKNSLQILSEKKLLKENEDFYFDGKRIKFTKNFKDVEIIFLKVNEQIKTENFKYKDQLQKEEIFEKKDESTKSVYITGVKGFNVLNQNNRIDIEQVTDFSIHGKIDSFWSVEGYINDNSSTNDIGLNAPIYQIENLKFSLYNTSGTKFFLGNSKLENKWSKFLNLNKEIFGLGFSTGLKKYPLSFSYAAEKGNFKSSSFFCIDGILGPYRIVEERNLFDYTITPGSEKVYLNGQLLENGEDKDYTIDYYTGELTFTNKHIVDQNSYVYIEFQQFDIISLNSGYYISLGDEKNDLKMFYSSEGNQINDQKLKEELSLYPSDSSYILLKSYEFVGENRGDYFLQDSIFVFAGEGKGDYKVEFYYVGYGKGDYLYSPSNFSFVYVGKNNGNYSPFRRVSLPFFYHLLDISFTKNIKYGGFDLEILTGLYKNNRYNLQSQFLKDFSYYLSYNTKRFLFKNFSSSFLFQYRENDTIYKTRWNKMVSFEYIKNDTTFKTPFREFTFSFDPSFENIFNSNLSISKIDSFNTVKTIINTDTFFNYSADFRTIYFILKDSIYYKNEFISLTKKFKISNFSVFIENESRTFFSYKRGLKIFSDNRNFLMEYRNERIFEDSLKIKNIDVFKLETNKSERENFLALFSGEYKVFDYNDTKRNIVAINTVYKKIFTNVYEYFLDTYITSLSLYNIVETYVYVGKGKGDYVYDPITNSYIYDKIYGDYVLIKENKLSNDPYSKRMIKTSLRLYQFETFINLNYSDLSKNLLETKQNNLNETNLNFKFFIDKILNRKLTPFMGLTYEKIYYKNLSSFKNFSLDLGIKNLLDINYSLLYRNENEKREEITGKYYLNSNSIIFEFNLGGLKQNYKFKFSYGNFYGFYDYDEINFSPLKGTKVEFFSDIEQKIISNFSFNLIPKISYTFYNEGDDLPLSINYKYPKGIFFENTLSIVFINDFVNSRISYILDYSLRNSLRQRVLFSLFTYF